VGQKTPNFLSLSLSRHSEEGTCVLFLLFRFNAPSHFKLLFVVQNVLEERDRGDFFPLERRHSGPTLDDGDKKRKKEKIARTLIWFWNWMRMRALVLVLLQNRVCGCGLRTNLKYVLDLSSIDSIPHLITRDGSKCCGSWRRRGRMSSRKRNSYTGQNSHGETRFDVLEGFNGPNSR
jgi:hypothetical protein